MKIHIPQPEFLTAKQVMARFECAEDDVRRLILEGRLRPSYRVDDLPCRAVSFEVEVDGHQEFFLRLYDVNCPGGEKLSGFYFLRDVIWTEAHEGRFNLMSEKRDTPKDGQSGQPWLLLDSPLSLSRVLEKGAFLVSEIQLFETTQVGSAPVDCKPLASKERNSLLKLVIGMAIGGYRYSPEDKKSTVTMTIVEDLQAVGVGLDAVTVRKYLDMAVENVLEKKR